MAVVKGMAPSEALFKILGGRTQKSPPPLLGGSYGDPAPALHSCSEASGEPGCFPVSP